MSPSTYLDISVVNQLSEYFSHYREYSEGTLVPGQMDSSIRWMSYSHILAELDLAPVAPEESAVLWVKAGLHLQKSMMLTSMLTMAPSAALAIPDFLSLPCLLPGRPEMQRSNNGVSLVFSEYAEAENSRFGCFCFLGLGIFFGMLSDYERKLGKYSGINVLSPWAGNISDTLCYSVQPAEKPIIVIDSSLLEFRNPDKNKKKYQLKIASCQRYNDKFLSHLSIVEMLNESLRIHMQRRYAGQSEIAQELGISVRKMQRRLKAMGVTYQDLLDHHRCQRAIELMAKLDTPVYEISYMVGYSEPSAFFKAFKRWTGVTPGEYMS